MTKNKFKRNDVVMVRDNPGVARIVKRCPKYNVYLLDRPMYSSLGILFWTFEESELQKVEFSRENAGLLWRKL